MKAKQLLRQWSRMANLQSRYFCGCEWICVWFTPRSSGWFKWKEKGNIGILSIGPVALSMRRKKVSYHDARGELKRKSDSSRNH